MKRLATLLIVVGVFLFGAGLVGKLWQHFTSPAKLRAAASEQFDQYVRGKLTLASIHLSPSLRLDARGGKAFPPGDPEPVLTWDRASVRFDRSRFLQGTALPASAVIIRPALFLRRDGKTSAWNVTGMLRPGKGGKAGALSPGFLSDGFVVEDGSVSIYAGKLFPDERAWTVSGINLAAAQGHSGPERWNLTGSIRKGRLSGMTLSGWYETGQEGGLCLTCSSESLRADKSFVLDVPSAGEDIWKLFQPEGPLSLSATIRQSGKDGALVYVVNVQPGGCRSLTRYFPAAVSAVVGAINISGSKVVFRDMRGLIEPEALGFSKDSEVPVEVRVNGVYDIDSGAVTVEIEAANMMLCQRSIEAIPGSGKKLWQDLKPSGHTDLRIWVSDEPGKRSLARATARLKNATINPAFLPVPLEAVTGTVDVSADKAHFRDVTAEIRPAALGLKDGECQPVKVKLQGSIDLASGDLQLDIEAADVPLCQKLVEAIPGQGERLWRELKPEGMVDLTIRVTVPGNGAAPTYRATVRLESVNVRPQQLPLPLEKLTGEVDLEPGVIHFRDVTAIVPQQGGPAHLTLDGTCDLELKNRKLKIEWHNLLATEQVVRWLPGFGSDLWALLKPEGYSDGTVMLNGGQGGAAASGQVVVRSGKVTASFLALPIVHLAGTLHFEGDHIELSGFTGRLVTEGATADEAANFGHFTLNGSYDVSKQGGSFQVDIPALAVCEPVVKKVPALGERLWTILQPEGVASVSARLIYDKKQKEPLTYFVDVNLRNATVRWNWCPVPLRAVSGHVVLTEKMAIMPMISGQLSGGWFDGSAFVRYGAGDKPLTYGATAEFRRVSLPLLLEERTGKKYDLKGYLSGLVQLEGNDGPDSKLTGVGSMDMADGYLWSIPVFMGIVEVLHLGIPSAESAFDTANMRFGLDSAGVQVQSVQIVSRGTELTGAGTIGWDGKLNMSMVAATLAEGGLPIVGPAWRFMLRPIEKELVKLTVTGTIDKPTVKPGVLAPLGRPIESLYDLVSSPFRSSPKEEEQNKEEQKR